MEPTLPSPHGAPEVRPPTPGLERVESVEPVDARVAERGESREQKTSGDGSPSPVVTAPPVVTMPTLPADSVPVGATAAPVDDISPATAADDDLIEKEWVEKAKQVIADNRNDPYMQERAVSRLQAAYLQKRYGKTIKLPEEG